MARQSAPFVLIVAVIAVVILAFLYNPFDQAVGIITGMGTWSGGSEYAQDSKQWVLWLWVAAPLFLIVGYILKLWQASKEVVGQ